MTEYNKKDPLDLGFEDYQISVSTITTYSIHYKGKEIVIHDDSSTDYGCDAVDEMLDFICDDDEAEAVRNLVLNKTIKTEQEFISGWKEFNSNLTIHKDKTTDEQYKEYYKGYVEKEKKKLIHPDKSK